ncbi:MAG: Serine/threonine-protein kinase PknB [Planctomycetota bacterium]|jgi:serine/threonine protein kinase
MSGDDNTEQISDLDRLLGDCLERLDRGEHVDPEELLRQYPQHAAGLRAFFIGNAQLEKVRPAKAPGEGLTSSHTAGDYVVGDEILGRYRLLQLIGEGGMGAVWLAQQTQPVRRRVAIKLIRPGMDSKLVLARFDAERQALALMDHPNIARVHDGGVTERGRPFFVMEYLRGTPLTDYCDQARLSVRERMELFLQVCRAVQHAHTKGIVHRDLKPSNILVCHYDGRPVPKVIDFGLAKALNQDLTDLTLHTAHGVMVGTPIYMSPEQAEMNNLDVDTRTDVYSLGVVLYELLTGTTPLDRDRLQRAAMQEMLRLIREEDPLPPSTRLSSSERLPLIAAQRNVDPTALRNSLSGDLDWIVMKALEKERVRRYETAVGLAEDIQRFLTDGTVSARPPGRLYRLSRLLRRHKVAVFGASAVLVGAAAAAAGLMWGWKASTQASTHVRQSIIQAEAERDAGQRALQAKEQQQRAARRIQADGILRSIGLEASEGSAGMGISGHVPEAELAALRAWADLQDDSQRIGVLEQGLSDARIAQQLARRSAGVLRACVGLSPVRRQQVLQLLSQKQRCGDCAAEIRGASCLLTADLGGSDLHAIADLGSLGIPTQNFQRQAWRVLPTMAAADRQRVLEFLLLDDPTTQTAAYIMSTPFSEDAGLLEEAVADSAELLWKRIRRDLRTAVAGLKNTTDFPAVRVPNVELLPSIFRSLPETAVAGTVTELLELIESRSPEVSRTTVRLLLHPDSDLLLIRRLTTNDAAVLAQRIISNLSRDADQDRMETASAYLSEMLPKLSVPDRHACHRQLLSIVPSAVHWEPGYRWRLAGLLERCVSSLPPSERQLVLTEILALTAADPQPRVVEILAPALVGLLPLLTADQIAGLWENSLTALRSAAADEDFAWWMIVMCEPLAGMATRLSAAGAQQAVADLLALPADCGQPLVAMPAVMSPLSMLVEQLTTEQLLALRKQLLEEMHRDTDGAPSTTLQAAASNRHAVEFLLQQVCRHADQTADMEFLEWLQTINYTDENFGALARIAAPSLDQILPRIDGVIISGVYDSILTRLRGVDWRADHALESAIKGSALLKTAVRHLDEENTLRAWHELLEFLKPSGEPGEFLPLWDGNYSTVVAPALRELALRLPEDQTESALRQLVQTMSPVIPNIDVVSPSGQAVSLFRGTAEPLADKLSPAAARSFIAWLRQQSETTDGGILSLALQAAIPRLDDQQIPVVWDELYNRISVPRRGVGAVPFRDLGLRLATADAESRWVTTLKDLQATEEVNTAQYLSGVLMALLPHVSADSKNAAVDPMIHALQVTSRTLVTSGLHGPAAGSFDDRTERATLFLAEHLSPANRNRLADAALRLLLQFRPPWSGVLSTQLQLTPISTDPGQIARLLCHPDASAEMQEKLLIRFEELVLLDGRSLNPQTAGMSPFSDQYVLDPDDEQIETVDAMIERRLSEEASGDPTPMVELPERPRRRFMSIHDAAEWIRTHWPDFKPDELDVQNPV